MQAPIMLFITYFIMFRKVHLTHVTMDYLYPEGRLVIGKNYISFVDLIYILEGINYSF